MTTKHLGPHSEQSATGRLTNGIAIGVAGSCMIWLSLATTAIAEEPDADYSLSAGLELSHGDYGSDESTDTVAFLPAINWNPTDRLSAMLTIPYLYQSNNAIVPVGGGHFPMPREKQGTSTGTDGTGGMGGSGHMGSPGGGGQQGHHSPPEYSDESQSGLGDIMLNVGYELLAESGKTPGISTEIYVKFPTADEDKGLGTGAYDYGLGLSFDKSLRDWLFDAQVLYVMPGSSPFYDLVDYWDWSVSSNYLLTNRSSIGLGLSGATNPFAGTGDLFELDLSGSFWTSANAGVWATISLGLNDSSADYRLGIYGTLIF